MRITVTRSGGFAGMRKEAVVDDQALSARDREALGRLVAAAESSAANRGARSPDAFTYRVTIVGEHSSVVDLDDGSMPDAWRQLVEWVLRRG